jgi:HSP20 family molecular chaperone IbpA
MKHRNVEKASRPAIVQLLPDDLFVQRTAVLRELIAQRAYELFSDGGFTHGHDLEDWLRAESEFLTPVPVEVVEAQDTITVKSALPGFDAADIEVHVEPRHLFISGQQLETSARGKNIGTEQRLKRMFRSLDLPAQIDPERVSATFSNGELQVDLPKVKAVQKAAAASNAAA